MIKLIARKVIQFERWTITNDTRAVAALNEHIRQYGPFDAGGHGAGGDIAAALYRAYRPYACPAFDAVWPIDGNWNNLVDYNLRSDADETDLPDNSIPITTQRRIWHDEHRIFIKLPAHDTLFFTEWDRRLFELITDKNGLSGWYIQRQARKTTADVYRLYARIAGKGAVSLAEIVALYDAGRIDLNDAPRSLLEGKKWLRENNLQVDHLRNNPQNNCRHNLVIMTAGQNLRKAGKVTNIRVPFGFICVWAGGKFRIVTGKFAGKDQYTKYISCANVEEFLNCLNVFRDFAVSTGEMLPPVEDVTRTVCLSQMLCDDGQELHNGEVNLLQWMQAADESDFTPWAGEPSLVMP